MITSKSGNILESEISEIKEIFSTLTNNTSFFVKVRNNFQELEVCNDSNLENLKNSFKKLQKFKRVFGLLEYRIYKK